MNILLSGGTGYIGSLMCVRLMESGFDPILLDNFSNSKPAVLDRIAAVTGRRPVFFEADVRDRRRLDEVLARHRIDAAIHFAGLKAVGQSVQQPLAYYDNNVHGSCMLLGALDAAGVRTIVFQLFGHGVRRRQNDASRRGRADSTSPTPTAGPN